MHPANIGFLEDVLHVVFIEIVSFDRYGAVCLRIVVNVVISTVAFQFITGSTELFNRLLPCIHYVPPLIISYTILYKSQLKYKKIQMYEDNILMEDIKEFLM